MPNYCDTDLLESYWFEWVLAKSTSDLEPHRINNILTTKVIAVATNEEQIPYKDKSDHFKFDPNFPIKIHLLENDIWQCSIFGELFDLNQLSLCPADPTITSCLVKHNTNWECILNERKILTFDYETIRTQERTAANGYFQERPIQIIWDLLIKDFYRMCFGIAANFYKDQDLRLDLAHEAIQAVIGKLQRNSLRYIPGKAPVFNLLTTTITRIMLTIVSKNNKQKAKTQTFLTDLNAGMQQRGNKITLPDQYRKLRIFN